MHLITPPLPFGPLPFGQIAASLGFISTRLIYLLPSSPFRRLLHPVPYPRFAPLFAADSGLYITDEAS